MPTSLSRAETDLLIKFHDKSSTLYTEKVKETYSKSNSSVPPPIQQSDYLSKFLLTITKWGLEAAYKKYGDTPPGPRPPVQQAERNENTTDVIIVGAGMAGLSAAYELKRAGYTFKILEQTDRFGGRVFTYDKKDGLATGLYGEAGAMRLPGKYNSQGYKDTPHFLTDFYIDAFELPTQPFPQYDDRGLTSICGRQCLTTKWAEKNFDQVWPEWNKNIKGAQKEKITNIDEYYKETTKVVTNHLRTMLEKCKTIKDEIYAWGHWIDIWSQFTFEGFLESSYEGVKSKMPRDVPEEDIKPLKDLLPWPHNAVRGYSVFTYTQQLDLSLVEYLREQLGNWWSHEMHCLKYGMHSLPDAFVKNLHKENIEFNTAVKSIVYTYNKEEPKNDLVQVICYPKADGKGSSTGSTYLAKAVIVTTPVNILRQITFKGKTGGSPEKTVEAPTEYYQAIENVFTAPSTKIFVQTKTRFWEEAPYNINGGFSKTNLPIGQLHYIKPEDNATKDDKNKGLLMAYTWKNEALLFGCMKKEHAVREAIEQIATIHPEIYDSDKGYDNVGLVHAWYDQPASQGAYGVLKPRQFNSVRYLWRPMDNVHFAGEAFSFAAGWIQGALESGLKAAYQVYARFQQPSPKPAKTEVGTPQPLPAVVQVPQSREEEVANPCAPYANPCAPYAQTLRSEVRDPLLWQTNVPVPQSLRDDLNPQSWQTNIPLQQPLQTDELDPQSLGKEVLNQQCRMGDHSFEYCGMGDHE